MAYRCYFCGKKTVAGRQISHAHNVTRRKFRPNLQRVRALIDGQVKRIKVCTTCIKMGKVKKPPLSTMSHSAV